MQQQSKSISKKIIKYILLLDQFGEDISLRIKSQKRYNTIIGSLFSVSIYVFIIYTFTILFLEMFDGQTPTIISRTIYSKDPELTELTSQNFEVAVTLADSLGQPLLQSDQSVIYVPILSICNRTSLDNKCEFVNLIPCSQISQKKQLTLMGLDEAQISLSYCFPDEVKTKKIFLQGYSFSTIFQAIAIDIYPCNSTLVQTSQKCADEKIIQDNLSYGFFGLVISDKLFNPQLKGNPFSLYGKTITTTFSTGQYKLMQSFLRPNYIETIENYYYYFMEKRTLFEEILFEKMNEYTDYVTRDSLISIVIQLDDKKVNYYRYYSNILNIFGNISGLIKILMLITRLILAPLVQKLLQLFMANKLYSFSQLNKKFQKSKSLFTIHPNETLEKPIEYNQLLFQYLLENKFEQKNKKLITQSKINENFKSGKFTLQNFLFSVNRKQRSQVLKGIEKIFKKIDSVYLIKKLMEIEQLKLLLLTPSQLILFENLPKPKVFIEKSTYSSSKTTLTDQLNSTMHKKPVKFIEQIKLSFEAYQQIIKQQTLTNIDQQLIKMVDQDLISLYNEVIKRKLLPQLIQGSNDDKIEQVNEQNSFQDSDNLHFIRSQ